MHLDIKQGRPLSIVELEFWEDTIIVMHHIFSIEDLNKRLWRSMKECSNV
jgi:hypothetical protein